jgi:hypothetical protein
MKREVVLGQVASMVAEADSLISRVRPLLEDAGLNGFIRDDAAEASAILDRLSSKIRKVASS